MKILKSMKQGLLITFRDEESLLFIKQNLPIISFACLMMLVAGMALGLIVNV